MGGKVGCNWSQPFLNRRHPIYWSKVGELTSNRDNFTPACPRMSILLRTIILLGVCVRLAAPLGADASPAGAQVTTANQAKEMMPWEAGLDAHSKWHHPVLEATMVPEPPVIDGVLDDGCWRGLLGLTGFRSEAQRRAVTEKTEALICYDQRNIYVGFRCWDSQPKRIRAVETKRASANILSDDWVYANITPLHDHRHGFNFYVNPRGAQFDSPPGGAAEKIQWRGDWQAAARIQDWGWSAEMAVPFSVLRYPKGQSEFGITFTRYLAREDEAADWPAMPNDVWTSEETGDWVGLKPPVPKQAPVTMVYTAIDSSAHDEPATAGLDSKYVFAGDHTVMLTAKPDFRNVEDEVESIIFSYQQKYVDDRRPFFVEGSDYLPDESLFYSRTIEKVDTGIKFIGREANTDMGFLHAAVLGEQNDTAASARVQYDPYTKSTFSIVAHQSPGMDNIAGGFSLKHSILEPKGSTSLSVSSNKSWTDGPGGDGSTYEVSVSQSPNPGYLGFKLDYLDTPEDFNPVDGFVDEKGFRGWLAQVSSSQQYVERWLQSWGWKLLGTYYTAPGGVLHDSKVGVSASMRSHDGRSASVSFAVENRPPNHDQVTGLGVGWNENSTYNSGSLNVEFGRRASMDYRYLSASQGYRPGESWAVSGSLEYQRLQPPGMPADDLAQIILAGNYDLTLEKSLAARIVQTGARHNFYVSYRQVVRRGTDVYLILGNPNSSDTESRIALKLVRVF